MFNQQLSLTKFNDYPGSRSRNQVIPNVKNPNAFMVMDCDIVSASRQHLEKFIRELHGLTTHVKTLYSSLYPSIILENNLAPNTQIGRIIIEDPEHPERKFGLCEHPDMYSSGDDDAKYSRGGEFLENLISANPLEFGRRWLGLGDIYQVLEDLGEFFKFNKYNGKPIDFTIRDAIYYTKTKGIQAVEFYDKYMAPAFITFENTLDTQYKEDLISKIKEGALL